MDIRDLVLIAHVLVFGIWFGTDVATFTLSRRVLDSNLELPTRAAMAAAMTSLEVIARLCLPTMLALGIYLSIEGGFTSWGDGGLPTWLAFVALLLAAAWVALVWTIHQRSGHDELASRLSHVDLAVRSVVCLGLVVVGASSLLSDGGLLTVSFLEVKVLIFALIMATGITIRILLRPFGAAFATLMSEGSTAENEAALKTSLRTAQPLVGVIWVSLIASVALGVLRSIPWM